MPNRPLLYLLLGVLCTLATADDETRWRERGYALTGDPQPESDRKPLYRVRRRGARQLRLHFSSVRLTAGEVLEIYDGRLGLVQRITASRARFWSAVIPGESAWLRLRHRGDGAEGQFTVDRIAYRTRLPAPAGGSSSPSHYTPKLTTLKLFRVHPNGDADRLRPGARIRLARRGGDPSSFTFAVHGYDQKGLLLAVRDFRPVVRYEGSTMKGTLAPVGRRRWRFGAGQFPAEGLVVEIAVPDSPAFSTRLLVDVMDDPRAARPLDTVRVWRRRPDGTRERLASGTVILLAAQGQGQDSFDLSVTPVDRKGAPLSPAALERLRLVVAPRGAGRVETKSLGEYRVHAGPKGVEAGRLTLRLGDQEALRLTLQVIARGSHTLAAAAPVARAADQPYEVPAVSRLVLAERFRGRRRFELAGPGPATILRVVLERTDGTHLTLFDGKLEFAGAWRWGFAASGSPPLGTLAVRWQGKPGAVLRLFTTRRPADGPDQGTRRTPPGTRWQAVESTLGTPGGGGRGQAIWAVGLGVDRAVRLRVTPNELIQLDRLVLTYVTGESRSLTAAGRRLPSGQSFVFELPRGKQLSRVTLHYRTREEAAQPRIRLDAQLGR